MITRAEIRILINKVVSDWNALWMKRKDLPLQYHLIAQKQRELRVEHIKPIPQQLFENIFDAIGEVKLAFRTRNTRMSQLEQMKLKIKSIKSQILICTQIIDGISKLYVEIIANAGVLVGSQRTPEISSNAAKSEQQDEQNQDDSDQAIMDSSKTKVNEWIDKNQKWLLGELPYASSKQHNPTTLMIGVQVSEDCETERSQNSLARPT